MTRRKVIAFLATACIATFITLLITMRANAEEIYLPDGSKEPATCTTLFTEPARYVCVSKHAVCTRYEWSQQEECFWRPIKNAEEK